MNRQIVVYYPGNPKALGNVFECLTQPDISICGFHVEPNGPYSVVRLLFGDAAMTAKATDACRKNALGFYEEGVLVLSVPQKDLMRGLLKVTQILGEHEIKIEYGYSLASPNSKGAFFAIGVKEDMRERATQILRKRDILILDHESM